MTEVRARHRNQRAQPHHGRVHRLPEDHTAVFEGRTLHPHLVRDPDPDEWVLKKGEHNRKLGSHVTKGRWKGFPIYGLTLEERATCPDGCPQWRICYGNHMSQARAYRYRHGPALETEIERELHILSVFPESRRGFVVRLHVLGDFYSVDYVQKWAAWLNRYPALHVFGFTAWQPGTEIGARIERLREKHWDRFAIRFSNDPRPYRSAGVIAKGETPNGPGESVCCPAESGLTDCCGTCGLCWTTDKRIVFVEH